MDRRVTRTRARALAAGEELLRRDGIDAVTHARVAREAGLGRRTLYRHWPDRRSLLRDVLSRIEAPPPRPGADLRTAVVDHLVALDDATTTGPLAYVVAALAERAAHDAEVAELRDELVAAGCAPLVEHLRSAVADGHLPPSLDLTAAAAMLEGPVFYGALLHGRPTGRHRIEQLVDAVLATPPTR